MTAEPSTLLAGPDRFSRTSRAAEQLVLGHGILMIRVIKGISPELRMTLSRYAIAALVFLVAYLARASWDHVLQESGFGIFCAAVLIIGWVAGLAACLVSQFAFLAISFVYFPVHDPAIEGDTVRAVVGLSIYFFIGIASALLGDSRRLAQRRVHEQAAETFRQREQLRTAFSCMGDAVLITDADGRVTMMNPVSERLTGWKLAECIGRDSRDVLFLSSGEEDSQSRPVERVLRRGEPTSRDRAVILTAKDGSQRPIDYTSAPVRDAHGHVTGAVVIFRDDSERIRTERSLRDADRRKDEFLALLAHELRNPLAPIGNALQILKLSDDDPSLRNEVQGIMQHQFDHLVRLVDDLLDVSRIARGKIELRIEDVSLASVIQRAVEAAQPLVKIHQHALSIVLPAESLIVRGDPVRLAQIITNLLTNAAKYTRPGGKIELSVEREDGSVLLRVRDNGIGIDPEMLGAVFEMFTQGHSPRSGATPGLGLGLSVVKSIVQMHGGQVEARSDGPDRGSEFIVRLPLAQPARKQPDQTSNNAGSARLASPDPRTICIVDDNVDSANSLAQLLKLHNHRVHVAHNGTDAIGLIPKVHAEIVFLDIGMPGMDGYEVAKQLRSQSNGDSLVLAALTGWGSTEDRRRTQAAGFDHHFVKPIKLDEIDAVLKAHSSSASSGD